MKKLLAIFFGAVNLLAALCMLVMLFARGMVSSPAGIMREAAILFIICMIIRLPKVEDRIRTSTEKFSKLVSENIWYKQT
jgi:hypothetical protein